MRSLWGRYRAWFKRKEQTQRPRPRLFLCFAVLCLAFACSWLAVGLGYLDHSANHTAKSFRPWFDVLGILWVPVALMYMWRAMRDKRRRSAKTREHTTR